MPYAIQRDETLDAAARRIMAEQIVRARDHLTMEGPPIEKRVHDARKRFKEARALVRMFRGPLGDLYRAENVWFRDAGRELAGPRDAAAVLESLGKLSKVKTLLRKTLGRTRLLLRARVVRAAAAGETPQQLAAAVSRLVMAQARIGLWPPIDDDFRAIGAGILRVHRGGRDAMLRARDCGTPVRFHDWRKLVKAQWYHALLLRNLWPEMMKAWAGVLEQLARTLGDHHDLVLLRQIVIGSHRDLGGPGEVVALLDAIEWREKELEAEALRIGALVYAERPRAWLARIASAWAAWRP